MAGTLLTTTAVTIVPAAYAGNENEAEEDSNAALDDCDDNDVFDSIFECLAFAGDESRIFTPPPTDLTTTTTTTIP